MKNLELEVCPYREVCSRPCEEAGELNWVPTGSFKLTEEGIKCPDWPAIIPLDKLTNFSKPEGRHLAGLDSADKIDATRRKYGRTEKRKKNQRNYAATDKGKKTTEKYLKSERAKLCMQKYRFSEKGQKAYQNRLEQEKLFRGFANWSKENPGKTIDDYLKTIE